MSTTHILLHLFRNYTDNGDEKNFTVYFHAILSDKFKFEDGMQIVIRGKKPVFGGWDEGGVSVATEK